MNQPMKGGENMAYVEWTDDFSVNVEEIDTQHKTLIAMLNTLHEALLSNKGKDVYKHVIDGMIEYATTHFNTEEDYMVKCNFPGYPEHKAEHERFVQETLQLQTNFNETGFTLTYPVVQFLKKWLKDHILETDKKYSRAFNEYGLY